MIHFDAAAPQIARAVNCNSPGSFKPGHKKLGGRKKGTPNALSADYVSAVLEAAYRVGRDGNGKDGFVGYLRWLFIKCPKVACILLSRVLALEDCGWPLETRHARPGTKSTSMSAMLSGARIRRESRREQPNGR